MDEAVFDMGNERWLRASGFYDLPRNEKGHIVLQPSAKNVDRRLTVLNTDMDKLEDTMRRYREERSMLERQTKTEAYKESKKKAKGKKAEKARQSFLDQVFNAVPEDEPEDDDEDEEGYRDLRGKKRGGKKPAKETTLESRYGKRYAAVVSLLQDTIEDFDRISANIEEELNDKAKARNMYRSTQLGNLLSAKNSRLSAIKEMARIADKVTDIEYKKSKDKGTQGDETNMSKVIASLGRDVLRGNIVLGDKKGKKKKDKDRKGRSMFERSTGSSWGRKADLDEDDDDDIGTVERSTRKRDGVDDPRDIDDALARELRSRKDNMYFSPYERNLDMEGKYTIAVTCSSMDTKNWSYIALDPKTGKALKGELRDRVKELMPKRKAARMIIELSKMKAKDLNSGKSYKLLLTD